MTSLTQLLDHGRQPAVLGIDDTPFSRRDARVSVCGTFCQGDRLEGLLWTEVPRDGLGLAELLVPWIRGSKFGRQLHAVLLDGLTLGGLGVVDLQALSEGLELPVVAVLRRPPDLEAFRGALAQVSESEVRWQTVQRAGLLHQRGDFVFHTVGVEPEIAERLLACCTRVGKVPEPLRLAHLIGGGVKQGQSGRRA